MLGVDQFNSLQDFHNVISSNIFSVMLQEVGNFINLSSTSQHERNFH